MAPLTPVLLSSVQLFLALMRMAMMDERKQSLFFPPGPAAAAAAGEAAAAGAHVTF